MNSSPKSKTKKEGKRLYDMEYRRKNKDRLKKLKAERYQRDKHKYAEREKAYRKKRQPAHNKYCMRPEYRVKKRLYDTIHRAMRNYGEFWEAALIVNQLEKEVRKRIPKNERINYLICTDRNRRRNNNRRLKRAINDIMMGGDVRKILRRPWLEESKEILKQVAVK